MISIHTQSKGFYSLEVLDASGNVTRSTDWMPNLILDQGLLRMGANNDYLNVCSVGSGVSTPHPSNTALQSKLAQSSTVSDVVNGAQTEEPYYAYSRRTFTFTGGSVVGLVGELAVGWGGNAGQLFSRALVRNANGAPQAMPVLVDETLRVTFEHRYYPLITDTTGVLFISGAIGGNYEYIIRPSMVSTATQWTANNTQNNGSRLSVTAYNGEIGGITEQPSGNRLTMTGVTGTVSDTTATFAHSYENADLNVSGGIRSLMFAMGNGAWQIQFTPAIPKDADSSLRLQFSHTWGRR